jgi:hypothetical protein
MRELFWTKLYTFIDRASNIFELHPKPTWSIEKTFCYDFFFNNNEGLSPHFNISQKRPTFRYD